VFSRLVWSRIGAEHPADLIVDSTGFPVVEGGFSATARDVARFGQMHLQRGVVGDDRIVSSEWVDRVVQRDERLIDDFARGHDADPANPEAFYHDGWWVLDARLGRYTGLGLNGQHLLVDRSTDSVVVKLSTWPKRIDPLLAAHERAALTDLLTALPTAAP
jgi:CubicO group peptidase (beta-lactamase class C family)